MDELNSNPCPRCGKYHEASEYVKRPELKKSKESGIPLAPLDIECDCGAKLRHTVPLFKVTANGWRWRIL